MIWIKHPSSNPESGADDTGLFLQNFGKLIWINPPPPPLRHLGPQITPEDQ